MREHGMGKDAQRVLVKNAVSMAGPKSFGQQGLVLSGASWHVAVVSAGSVVNFRQVTRRRDGTLMSGPPMWGPSFFKHVIGLDTAPHGAPTGLSRTLPCSLNGQRNAPSHRGTVQLASGAGVGHLRVPHS